MINHRDLHCSRSLWINIYIKEPLFLQFNQFLDSSAEIHQIFEVFFWKI